MTKRKSIGFHFILNLFSKFDRQLARGMFDRYEPQVRQPNKSGHHVYYELINFLRKNS